MSDFYVAHFDGSSTPNPGTMSIGGVIEDNIGKTIFEFSDTLGLGTNNRAEYLALKRVCKELVRIGAKRAQIIGDSQLVVRQLNGEYKIKDKELKKIASEVRQSLRQIDHWNLSWVDRSKNQHADFLSKG